jgi:TatD DNase family protein
MLIDVHAHLDSEGFKYTQDQVIKQAENAGVSAIINCGLNPATNRATKRLSEKYTLIKPAYGIYPTDAEAMSDEDIEAEIRWIAEQKPIAISEIGLDGKWGKDLLRQAKVFRRMLELAIRLDVPVIVHTRQAEEQCFNLIESTGIKKVVLHCYTGPRELIKRGIANKWHFSIPPIIAYDKGFAQLADKLMIGQLLTETDSPYLAPRPGEVNTPANVALTVEKLAGIKGLTYEEMKKLIFMNYRRLF